MFDFIKNHFKHKPEYYSPKPIDPELERFRRLRRYTEQICSIPILAYTDYVPASWEIIVREVMRTNDDELIHSVYHTMTVYAQGTFIKQQRIDDLFCVKIKEWKIKKKLNDIEKDFE